MSDSHPIVIFDGECGFCDRTVSWIIAQDRAARFRFAPRQSPAAQRLFAENGLPPGGVESIVLIDGSAVFTHSTAMLRIASELSFLWNLFGLFLLVPRPIRDFGYRAFAKLRYLVAGRLPVCHVPTPEQRERMLVA
jgi:predicted DCC family thiol-disulfide oxidoreductase YuxK